MGEEVEGCLYVCIRVWVWVKRWRDACMCVWVYRAYKSDEVVAGVLSGGNNIDIKVYHSLILRHFPPLL